MAKCRKYEKLIKQLIGGEISREDESLLLRHTEACQHCRELVEAHHRLAADDLDLPDASEQDFVKVRQNVIRAIRNQADLRRIRWYHYIADHITALLTRPIVAAALAAILFLAGVFFGARNDWLRQSTSSPARQAEADFIKQLNYVAQQNTDLRQVENSPYLFSDVRIRDVNETQVALEFNVSTHLELVRDKNDPLVKEVVAQAVLNPAPLGNRLKAISYSEKIMHPKVKEALISALLRNDNLAVRLKALTSLAKYPSDPEIREALIRILNEDQSVQLRMMAIDYLTHQKLDTQTLEDAIKNLDNSEDAFFRYKLYEQINN